MNEFIVKFIVRDADWTQDHQELTAIRREVFIEEQHVPEELEWDDVDPRCLHVLAIDTVTRTAVGTGRLTRNGQIGRMAVRRNYRRQGFGKQILQYLVQRAKHDGHKKIFLHAQLYAVPFYQDAGFVVDGGEPFLDAGIEHVNMIYGV